MGQFRVTLKTIADACGFSVNTVSRALRDDPHLSRATREKIQKTALDLGYIRNSHASTLRSGKSGLIAVIINDVRNLHFCSLLSAIDAELRANGYNMMVLCMQLDESLGEHLIRSAISQGVDGILYFPYHNRRSHIEIMRRNHMPFVLLDRWIQNETADNVRCDDFQGGYLAGSHLTQLGHRSFLFLSGVTQSSSQHDRLEGFLHATREHGIPDRNTRVIPGEQVESALSEERFSDLLLPFDYTAIAAFRDEVAYPVMHVLEKYHVQIPEDLSIVSFDHLRGEIPYLARLTSIYSDEKNVGIEGVRLLLERIAHPDAPPQVTLLPVRLYDEGTTAPPGSRNLEV